MLATKVFGKMHDGPGGRGPVAQGDPGAGRRVARRGSAPTTSTCTRSTASTRTCRSRRRWRRSRHRPRPARSATSAPRRCTRGSSRSSQHAAAVGGWTRFVGDAGPVQPAPPARRTRADGDVPRHGRRPHAVLAARERPPRAPGGEQSNRSGLRQGRQAFDSPSDGPVVNAVQRVAAVARRRRGPDRACWVLRNPLVSAPIVGATKPHHLADASTRSTCG